MIDFWTMDNKEMQSLSLYERRKIIFSAMTEAKIMKLPKVWLFIGIMTLVTISLAVYAEYSSPFSFLAFITVTLIGILFGTIAFIHITKPDYKPFIESTLRRKEAILGSEEQRAKDQRNRNIVILANLALISFVLLVLS